MELEAVTFMKENSLEHLLDIFKDNKVINFFIMKVHSMAYITDTSDLRKLLIIVLTKFFAP